MAYANPFDLKQQRPGPSGDLVEEFLSGYDSHQTRRNYRADLKQFFGEEGATWAEAAGVDTEDIVEFLREKAGSLATSTLQRKAETLRSFYQWLAAQGLIDERPIGKAQKTTDLIEQAVAETEDTDEEKESDGEKELAMNKAPEEETSPAAKPETPEAEDSGKEESSGSSSGSGLPSGRARRNISLGSASEGESERASSGRTTRGSRGEEGGESSASNSTGSCSLPHRALPDYYEGGKLLLKPSADPNVDARFFDAPGWVSKLLQVRKTDLRLYRGEFVQLEELPGALRGALYEIADPGGISAERLFVSCDKEVSIYIQYQHDPLIIEVTIRHSTYHDLVRFDPDELFPDEYVAVRALSVLAAHGWAMPPELAKRAAATGQIPVSEKWPTWTRHFEDPVSAHLQASGEISYVLAAGFQLEKDEEMFLSVPY